MTSRGYGRGRIKGAAVIEFVRWYGRAVDGEGLRAAALELKGRLDDSLDPEHPALGFIASRWYDASTVHRLLDSVVAGRSAAEVHDVAQRGSAAVMAATLRGVFKTLFRMMTTPERYARFASLLWKVYYDSGEFLVTMDGPTRAVCTIRRWETHHPVICELNWGAARAIYEAMGCRDVVVERTDCVGLGGDECRFVSTWAR